MTWHIAPRLFIREYEMNSIIVGYRFGEIKLKLLSYTDGGFLLEGRQSHFILTVSMTPHNIFKVLIRENMTLANIVKQNASVWVIIKNTVSGKIVYDEELRPEHVNQGTIRN